MIGIPEWMSKEFFETAFRKHFRNQNVQILHCSSKPALPIGENYASDIFRTSITYRTQENGKKVKISVIVKCAPTNEPVCRLVQQMHLFETEAAFYTKILPAMNNLLEEKNEIAATCIHYLKDTQSVLIFEDLTSKEFVMKSRLECLDLEHCLMVVEKLAYLHGTSAGLYEKSPAMITDFTGGMYRNYDYMENWIDTGFNALIQACEKWPGYEGYSCKLRLIQDNIFKETLETKHPRKFNVLNHGDSWINNFMFSYTPEGKLQDFRFVDFQLILYGSPGIDLHYFWACGPNPEVKHKYLDVILDHYYNNLFITLKNLQYPTEKVPSKEQILEDFNAVAFYGLTATVTALPLICAPSETSATFEEYLMCVLENKLHALYENDRYRKHMEQLLPFYDRIGILH